MLRDRGAEPGAQGDGGLERAPRITRVPMMSHWWSWRSDRRAQFPKHPQVSRVGGQRWQLLASSGYGLVSLAGEGRVGRESKQ